MAKEVDQKSTHPETEKPVNISEENEFQEAEVIQPEESTPLVEEEVEVNQKLQELEDLLKRKAADFDNYRKRLQEEKDRIKDTSQEAVILDFLPVFDNLERALESCQAPGATLEGVKAGLEGIMAIFLDFLARWNVQKVNSVGQPFDPKMHEALFMQQGDYPQKEVIQEVEKAYMRKDKVIRTAKVGVGVPAIQKEE